MNRTASYWMWLVTLVCATWAVTPVAQAQKDGAEGKVRLGGFMSLGFGGEAVFRPDGGDTSVDDDLRVTGGFGALVDGVLMPYFGLGGLMRVAWWEPQDLGNGRATVIDFSVLPRARYPFQHGEIYLAVPVGFTMQFIPDGEFLGGEIQADSAIGWNVGLLLGGQVLVTDGIGIFGHMGGQFRGANHTGALVVGPFAFEGEVNVRTKQFIMELGVSFLL
jgi:hypothetical protein